MRTYRRITYEDRCQLYALPKAGKTQAEISQGSRVQPRDGQSKTRNAGRWRLSDFSKPSARPRLDNRRSGASHATDQPCPACADPGSSADERWSPEQLSFWLRIERDLAQP